MFRDAFTIRQTAIRWPQLPVAQRASGQTHSRARWPQDDADRADRSRAYLFSCIRVRSAHGNSFYDLVCKSEQGRGNFEAERFCGLEVDHQLELGRLRDR